MLGDVCHLKVTSPCFWMPDRDRTYLERILKMLDFGELKD
jgi:hypothetical protein